MTRTKAAATATPPRTLRDRKSAAVARVVARRRPPSWKTVGYGDDAVRVQLDTGSPFLEATTIDEWVDDRQARSPVDTPLADAVFQGWEMCRGGVQVAPEVVKFLADQVRDPAARFAVFMAINSVPPGPDGIGACLAREWKRAGLPISPMPPTRIEPTDWNAPSRQAGNVVYRSDLGHPAGMTL